jgi:THUMP domain-like/Methyltransferase domain
MPELNAIRLLEELQNGSGAALLREASASYGTADALALTDRLRRAGHQPALVAAALTQARLRARAVSKFGSDASVMFFTRDGLEQATRASVAAHRETRLARTVGTDDHVVDLCCGIGGDLVALAREGLRVTGVEQDPLTAAIARANVSALALEVRVVLADATTYDRTGAAAVVCDPARRTRRGRVFDVDAYTPPWTFVEQLLGSGTACVKVAPGIPHSRIPGGVEAEWVSDGGDLVEAALWSGRSVSGTHRRATLLPSAATLTDADDPGGPQDGPPLRYLYEPDDAVVRAGLVTAVAALVNGRLLDSRIAYVASDQLVATAFAKAYEVLDVLPYDDKALRAWVRTHDIGALTIKKRGVGVTPEELRRRLRPRGDVSATLVVTRSRERGIALHVAPCD